MSNLDALRPGLKELNDAIVRAIEKNPDDSWVLEELDFLLDRTRQQITELEEALERFNDACKNADKHKEASGTSVAVERRLKDIGNRAGEVGRFLCMIVVKARAHRQLQAAEAKK
jgi:hypothetical protein